MVDESQKWAVDARLPSWICMSRTIMHLQNAHRVAYLSA
jgi:hypothetical protein